ncbi:MAG: asparaginase [Halobacteriaceae archaeon]
MTRVHVLSTGGTIASTGGDSGAAPSKSGADLVDAVPGVDEHADVTVEEVASVPGFDMDPATMAEVSRRANAAVEDGADGVVVTHGTDTLAETAYFLDATLAEGVPAVVTGAQRRPDETSADGPANLRLAVRAAADDRVGGGAYVAFNDELHAGRDVVKEHTHRLDTFRSPNAGPVAVYTRGSARFYRDARRRATHLPVDGAPAGRVEMVLSAAGVDGAQVRRAVESGADGLVVAGTGLGNTTAELGEAIADAVAGGTPVVVCSRCHAGGVDAVYGTPGGGYTLREAGVIHAGDLPPQKARLKLLLALEHADEPAAVRPLVERR